MLDMITALLPDDTWSVSITNIDGFQVLTISNAHETCQRYLRGDELDPELTFIAGQLYAQLTRCHDYIT